MNKVFKAMLSNSPKFLMAGIIWGAIFGLLAFLLGSMVSMYVMTIPTLTTGLTFAVFVFLSVLLTWVFGGMIVGLLGNWIKAVEKLKGWHMFAVAYFLGATLIGIFKTLTVSMDIMTWIMAIVIAVILGYATQYIFDKLKIKA